MSARSGALGLVLLSATATAAHAGRPWSGDEAFVIPEGEWEVGIVAPLRWGVTDRLELSTHPLLDALMPALTLKVNWVDTGNFAFASEHTLAYPTILLRTLSTPGTGGIWPDETVVPHIVAFHSYAIASFVPWDAGSAHPHVFTARAGVMLAAQLSRSTLGTSDLWFLYPRTAHWVNGATLVFGLAAAGPIAGDFGYALDVDLYVMPGGEGSPIVEQSGRLTWDVSQCVRLQLGWAISAGDFPGPDDLAWLPTFDALLSW